MAEYVNSADKQEQILRENARLRTRLADAEEALRESEGKYRSLVESIGEGLQICRLIWDNGGRGVDYIIMDTNPAFEKESGLPREKVLGRPITEIFPAVQPACLERYAEVVRSGMPARFEEYDPTLGRWFEITSYSLGKDDLFAIIFKDITRRKQSEEAIRWSKSILAQAGKMARFGAWEIEFSRYDDINKNSLRWSDETYRIFGYEPGEVEVTNEFFFKHVHPDDRDIVSQTVARAIENRRPYSIEHRIIRADGSERILWEHADISFDPQGRPLRLIGAVQDITERKRAEEALKENEARLKMAQSAANSGAWEYDVRSGNGYWSEEYYALYGLEPGSIEPTYGAWLSHVHPDDRETLDREVRRLIRERKDTDLEFRIMKPNGEIRWLKRVGRLILDKDGKPVRMIGLTIDITERKIMEEALRESRDLLEVRVQERTAELQLSEKQVRRMASELIRAQEKERKRIAQELHDSLVGQLAIIKYRLERESPSICAHPEATQNKIGEIIDLAERTIAETRRIMANLRPSLLDDLGLLPTLKWYFREFNKNNPEIRIEETIQIDERDPGAFEGGHLPPSPGGDE